LNAAATRLDDVYVTRVRAACSGCAYGKTAGRSELTGFRAKRTTPDEAADRLGRQGIRTYGKSKHEAGCGDNRETQR